MPNRNYQRGYRLEHSVVKHLESLGWHAERRFMSKGGLGEDVIAWAPGWEDGVVMYVQCKADSKKGKQGMMSPKEWNRFYSNVQDGDYCILANGTPAHIKWHEITGIRQEGLIGRAAARDIEANMRDFEPMDVNQWVDEAAEMIGRRE